MDIDVEGFNSTFTQVRNVIAHRKSKITAIDDSRQRANASRAQITEPNDTAYTCYKTRTRNLERVSALFEQASEILTIYNNE